jgi:hypothetical protein
MAMAVERVAEGVAWVSMVEAAPGPASAHRERTLIDRPAVDV